MNPVIPQSCPRRFFCSTVTQTVGLVTAVALTVLGGLALLGIYIPNFPLAPLGHFFGATTAFTLFGAGALLTTMFATTLAVRSCLMAEQLLQLRENISSNTTGGNTRTGGGTNERTNTSNGASGERKSDQVTVGEGGEDDFA